MIEKPKSHRLIANYMTACTPLEQYIQRGGALTPLELDSISITVKNVQVFLEIWKRRQGKKEP